MVAVDVSSGKIDTQARTSFLKPEPQLGYALTNSAANGLVATSISRLQGECLTTECQFINAMYVLEIGTLGSYSTICVEINPQHRDVALENTKRPDMEIILGAVLDKQWEYFQWAVKLARKNWCIYVDNVVRELLESGNVGESESLVTKVGRKEKVTAKLVSMISSHKGKC
ncbi:hypothetical protein K469DRAFT_734647 [Zopfia rhizophila CBS 207.26]|uniref:Uncharacterized protein n=1 Tax=Zopfia rhizophila CBS 207.26 TaxID=1314779 RepID=A0A6A6ETL8_9PEZI|nr:hypothetical protein K469DRAFT_734647 [Zopfia rhizophila CBS 207.26]